MEPDALQSLIDDATFDFTLGETERAIAKLRDATVAVPTATAAWHALAEILLQQGRFDEALTAAETAHQLNPEDLFINTTLSRIWVGKRDKNAAEKFGAQAKMLSWKDQLKNPADYQGGL